MMMSGRLASRQIWKDWTKFGLSTSRTPPWMGVAEMTKSYEEVGDIGGSELRKNG
jgi:hypothetical protein